MSNETFILYPNSPRALRVSTAELFKKITSGEVAADDPCLRESDGALLFAQQAAQSADNSRSEDADIPVEKPLPPKPQAQAEPQRPKNYDVSSTLQDKEINYLLKYSLVVYESLNDMPVAQARALIARHKRRRRLRLLVILAVLIAIGYVLTLAKEKPPAPLETVTMEVPAPRKQVVTTPSPFAATMDLSAIEQAFGVVEDTSSVNQANGQTLLGTGLIMADGDQRYFVTGLETFMNARKPSVRMTGGGQIALEGLGLWLKGALVFFVLPPEAASSVAGLTAESSAQLQSLSLALLDIAPSKGATKALAFTFKNELQQGFFEGELGIIGKLVPGAPVFSAATMLPVGAVISNDDTHARLEAYDVRIESVAMPLEFLLQQAARYRNFCLRTESLKALAAPQFDRSKLEDLEIASLVTAVRTKLLSQSVARGMKMDDPHAERLMGDFAKGLAIFAKSDLVHFELEYFFQKAQAQLPQRQEYLKQAAKTMTAEKITK